MRNENNLNRLLENDDDDLMKLVNDFLVLSEKLLAEKIITKEQYDEITYNKINFLNDVKHKMYLNAEMMGEHVVEKNI